MRGAKSPPRMTPRDAGGPDRTTFRLRSRAAAEVRAVRRKIPLETTR
jgi:hypothetical protein